MIRVNKQSEALLILMQDGFEPFELVADSRDVNGWADLHAMGLVKRTGINSSELTTDGHFYLLQMKANRS